MISAAAQASRGRRLRPAINIAAEEPAVNQVDSKDNSCRHTFVHRMLSGYWTNGVGCSIETVAFWDADLRDDAAANQWLEGEAVRTVLEKDDQWQKK